MVPSPQQLLHLAEPGCIESRSHSNSTISDVTISAPCARIRSSAASRFAGSREPTASATTTTRCSPASRSATVCSTHTCASTPPTTISRAAGGSSVGSATPEKDVFETTFCG